MTEPSFSVYILEMENGALYTGYAADLAARYAKHCSGRGAKFTRAFRPVRIAACWNVENKGDAMRAEAFIKNHSRNEKIMIIDKPGLLQKMMQDERGYEFTAVPVKRSVMKKIALSCAERQA